MSASNWAVCPRCKARNRAAINALDDAKALALSEAYGRVQPSEYITMVNTSPEYPVLKDEGLTFREDYEIYGAEHGVVSVDYGGECTVCHLSVLFSEEHPIPDVDK